MSEMSKLIKMHMDPSKNKLKLPASKDLHRLCEGTRSKILASWWRQAVQAGIVQEGNSRRQSVVRLEGSLELLDQFKIALEPKFYDRLVTEIEKQTGQILEQQFSVNWETIETAMEKVTGKDSVIMLTEDCFSNQDPKVGGRTINSAIHQIKKYFFKYHSPTPRIIRDKKTGQEM